MSRSVITYAILLVAALVGAYLTWSTDPATEVSEGVVIADFTPENLERIEYEAPKKSLTVTAKSDDGDRYWWVEATRTVEVSEPEPPSSKGPSSATADAGVDTGSGLDAGSDAGDAGESGAERADSTEGNDDGQPEESKTTTKHEVYKASSIFDRFLEDISPLRARRKLPDPSAERRKAYGFDGGTKKLVLTTDDGSHTFTVGAHTYGRQHIYMRDEQTGDYYVVEVGVIGPFKYSDTRLREERIMDGGEETLKSVAVQSDGRSAKLVRHNRDDPSAAYWSFGDKSERNETAQSWIAKLMRIQIDRYLPGERPAGLKPRLVLEMNETDGTTNSVQVFERTAGDVKKYYAESDFTKGYVQLKRSTASTLVSDLSTLFEAAKPGNRE